MGGGGGEWGFDAALCHKRQTTTKAYGSFIQSTLVISKSKGLSEILRDIRTSTYQIYRIEEKNKLNMHISQMNK